MATDSGLRGACVYPLRQTAKSKLLQDFCPLEAPSLCSLVVVPIWVPHSGGVLALAARVGKHQFTRSKTLARATAFIGL
jgi:hypothetical protein